MASDQTKVMPSEWVWMGGRWRLMSTVKVPLHDADGQVCGLIGFARDAAEPEQPSAQAEILYEVSKALAAASDPEGMLRAVAGPAMKTGAHVAILMHLDTDAEGQPEWARVVAVIGKTTTPLGARFYVPGSSQASLLGASSEQPLLIGDIHLSHEAVNEAVRRYMQSIDAHAFAILPLRVDEQWQGVVTLAWPEVRRFSSEEKRLYTLVGAQLAIAIDNANLISEAQARAARERRVRDMTERIHRAADAQIIMRIALRELSQMLGTSKAVIRLGTRAQLEAELAKSLPGQE
jgi:GAF domain-containing protein